MMLKNNEIKTKNEIKEIKNLLLEINNRLNYQIKKSLETEYSSDSRRTLRIIRDKNLETYLKITEMEMVELIWQQ